MKKLSDSRSGLPTKNGPIPNAASDHNQSDEFRVRSKKWGEGGLSDRQDLEGSATKPRHKMFRFLEPFGMLAPQEADGKCPDTRLPKS